MYSRISTEARELLQKFGSRKVTEFRRGTSFAMIGQKGLENGKAIEQVTC